MGGNFSASSGQLGRWYTSSYNEPSDINQFTGFRCALPAEYFNLRL